MDSDTSSSVSNCRSVSSGDRAACEASAVLFASAIALRIALRSRRLNYTKWPQVRPAISMELRQNRMTMAISVVYDDHRLYSRGAEALMNRSGLLSVCLCMLAILIGATNNAERTKPSWIHR